MVQAPQVFYNAGAFDDDGMTGEQGVLFNVQLPALQEAGADVRWCGSTALLRVDAVSEVGGFSAGTVREDLDTTIDLLSSGWRTVYHHQTVAVGLAPTSPAAYLSQQRRRALGGLQVLTRHRLWRKSAVPGLSTTNRLMLLCAAGEGLRGLATTLAFMIPVLVLLSGATTTTAHPFEILAAFAVMWAVRLWGARLLLRRQIQWKTSLALSILRIPVGLASLRWLLRRDDVPLRRDAQGRLALAASVAGSRPASSWRPRCSSPWWPTRWWARPDSCRGRRTWRRPSLLTSGLSPGSVSWSSEVSGSSRPTSRRRGATPPA